MDTRASVGQSASRKALAGADERRLSSIEEGLERLSEVVDEAAGREGSWLDRLRAGLVAFLGFFDDEPGWGRLLVSEAPVRDASLALRCEQRVLGVLTGLLDDGSPLAIGELMGEPQLTSELVVGGVVAVIRKRVLGDDRGPFVGLAPELMSFIVLPYLGQAAARAELAGRPAPVGEVSWGAAELRDARLPIRATRRTMSVLRAIAGAPGSNNRQIAQAAGLSDEGQASKLLSRLAERGVIENVGVGAVRGEPNAWLLTSEGRRVLGLAGGTSAGGGLPGRVDGLASEGRVA